MVLELVLIGFHFSVFSLPLRYGLRYNGHFTNDLVAHFS